MMTVVDLEGMKQRLLERAQDAARDGETIRVTIGTRSDTPAWFCDVEWISRSGERETSGYAGPLPDLETHATLQIAARKLRAEDECE